MNGRIVVVRGNEQSKWGRVLVLLSVIRSPSSRNATALSLLCIANYLMSDNLNSADTSSNTRPGRDPLHPYFLHRRMLQVQTAGTFPAYINPL